MLLQESKNLLGELNQLADPKVLSGMNIREHTDFSKEDQLRGGKRLVLSKPPPKKERMPYPTKMITANADHPIFQHDLNAMGNGGFRTSHR